LALLLGGLVAATVTLGPAAAFRLLRPRIEKAVGAPVHVKSVVGRLGRVVLTDLRIGDKARVPRATLHYRAARLFLGRVALDPVVLDEADFSLGPSDLESLRARGGSRPEESGWLELGVVRVVSSNLTYRDPDLGLTLRTRLQLERAPGEPLRIALMEAEGSLEAGPSGTARRVDIVVAPEGPRMEIDGGRVAVSRGLELSDIEGVIVPAEGGKHSLRLSGGWGDAGARLWTAAGDIDPGAGRSEVRLHAQRFRLDRLGSVLEHAPVRDPDQTEVDADLLLRQADGVLDFEGTLEVTGLTVYHPGLGPAAVPNLSAALRTKGRFEPRARRLVLDEILAESSGVRVRLAGVFDRLGATPLIEAELEVIPVPCRRLLAALPGELLPVVRGFEMGGTFAASLRTRIDFAALDEVDLEGRVGIDGCRVLKAPEEADAERLLRTFTQHVSPMPDVEVGFAVGPENPDFTPYADISPHVVNSIMTTEDSRFFDHRGFIPREFRSALARDLRERRFAFGASSITMQMVKNVLLSPEKTLSRKLQELFLTWYVEQSLSKERIMEIYLNVIEFGPGIWGIGPASRHYFGKTPAEVTPREAAFFSSMLPSPKRRYAHYCRGAPSPKWERYLNRILRRMHERDRLTDEEFAAATATTLIFDRKEARPEAECLRFVEQVVEAHHVPVLPLDEPEETGQPPP